MNPSQFYQRTQPNTMTKTPHKPSVTNIQQLLEKHPKFTLMVQGTTSDAGKSTVVCGLGRIFQRQDVTVAPFKSQNMALNSAVTEDGGEIGRAQALQAVACRIPLHTDFNPVLLKPNTDVGCQVIINGKAISDTQGGNMQAVEYHDYKPTAMKAVLASHQRLTQQYDYVVAEGAGSPAEINLRENDIANMGFAEAVDCPVILVADIDRGGVFAHLTGTLDCLSESEKQRTIGFVINRFRGDISLLQDGLDWLEEKTGKPVLGVLPYLHGLYLDGEDAINTQQALNIDQSKLNVVIPVYPRISNHTDLDPLRAHPQVNLQLIKPALNGQQTELPDADLIILPGSKNTRGDLQFLIDQGWQPLLERHLRYGGKILGICGGLQMLGELIKDPHGLEGKISAEENGESHGFGWLPLTTELKPDKTLKNCKGTLKIPGQAPCPIQGYEIHAGLTLNKNPQVQDSSAKACLTKGSSTNVTSVIETTDNRLCALLSADEQVLGTYWHGLLDTPDALQSILLWAGAKTDKVDYQELREHSIDTLADSMDCHLDWQKMDDALSKFFS